MGYFIWNFWGGWVQLKKPPSICVSIHLVLLRRKNSSNKNLQSFLIAIVFPVVHISSSLPQTNLTPRAPGSNQGGLHKIPNKENLIKYFHYQKRNNVGNICLPYLVFQFRVCGCWGRRWPGHEQDNGETYWYSRVYLYGFGLSIERRRKNYHIH